MNPQLAGYLRSMPCPRFVGIVAMDFPTAALCELVVHRNRRILDPCRPVCGHYNGAIDNLQCELAAAATRADAAVLVHPEQLPERVAWLGQTFARLLVERARAESQQPVVEEALAAAEGSLAGELRIRQPAASSPGRKRCASLRAKAPSARSCNFSAEGSRAVSRELGAVPRRRGMLHGLRSGFFRRCVKAKP